MSNNELDLNEKMGKSGFEEQQAYFNAQSPNEKEKSSEFDLRVFISYFIKYWYVIVLTVLIGLIVAAALWFQNKDQVNVSFAIKPLPSYENSRYVALNSTKLNSFLSDASNQLTPIPDIQVEKLLSRFLERLQDNQATLDIAASSELFSSIADEGTRNVELIDFVQNIQFREPATAEMLERGRGSPEWGVSFGSKNASATRDFLEKWISQSTATTRSELVEEIQQAIDFNSTQIERLKDDLLVERKVLVNDYQRKLTRTIEELKDDAAIARSAGIKSNALTGNIIGETGGILAIQQNTERYLRGYVSLEEEIKQLQKRETPELYAETLDLVDQQLEKLNSDTSLSRVKQAFEESPLKNGEFQAVSLNPQFINISSKASLVIYIALGLILGSIFGFAIVTLAYLYEIFGKPKLKSNA
jgi:LPS O-antigen subunit length determinant protein (WzzB/FepE family)